MAEDLGTITVNVQDLGGPGGGQGGGGGSSGGTSLGGGGGSMPKLPKPGDGNFIGPLTREQQAAQSAGRFGKLWKDIAPSLSSMLPSGMRGITGGIGRLAGASAAGVAGIAAVAAVVALVVAAIAAMVAAVVVATKTLWAWRNQMLATAKYIGNIDPRIAAANANESVSDIRRRFGMAAAQGQYGALAIQQETALKDALAKLSNTVAPIKALLSALLSEALIALVKVLTEILKQLGQWFTQLFGTVNKFVSFLATALGRLVDASLYGASSALFHPTTDLLEALAKKVDARLAAIQRNTAPAGIRGANSWVIAEARGFGAKNW